MSIERVEFDEVYRDLREKLVEVFNDCGENCARAYYSHERDADDHEASNALQVLEPLVSNDLRDELREAYKTDREDLSLYYLREGEESLHDRYALVALRIAAPLLQELFDDEMGVTTESVPSNAVLEQQATLDSSLYGDHDHPFLINSEP